MDLQTHACTTMYRENKMLVYYPQDMKNFSAIIMQAECCSENLILSGHLRDLGYNIF
jgi:hypothetical protein